jgi:glycosyltransferase involved in cell wall biosynthesis
MIVAFHAPLKPPDHPDPSGDRAMAGLILAALERAGHRAEIASRLRMFDRTGNPAMMACLADRSRVEALAYVAACRARPCSARPRAMVTYHVHYKAPDVFGPAVAAGLGIPYVVVEGSRAPKRAHGPWSAGHALAESALDAADAIVVLNPRDRPMLVAHGPPGQVLEDLPPFLDVADWPDLASSRSSDRSSGNQRLRLLSVAMMRGGDKLASYRLLADALARLEPGSWTLDVVGDGPVRADVEAALAPLGPAVSFRGLVSDRRELAALYARADMLVWPAVNEAFGMVFLEAALQGCPAVAGDYGGVAGVVRDGIGGVLTAPGNAAAFAQAIADLGRDRPRLNALGLAARRIVREERTLDAAATTLKTLLDTVRMHRRIAS